MNKKEYNSEKLESFTNFPEFKKFCLDNKGLGLNLKLGESDLRLVYRDLQDNKVFVLGETDILESGSNFEFSPVNEEFLDLFKELYAEKYSEMLDHGRCIHFVTNEYAMQLFYSEQEGKKQLSHSCFEFEA